MHIPSCETTKLSILSFDKALNLSLVPNDNYDVGKWIYVPNTYCDYRYLLGTIGKRPLICIGINPSTAEPDNLDNTLKSVERIANYNGYDSFIMLNVYSQRATNPNDMERNFNRELHIENLKAFEYALKLCKDKPHVWLACGTIIEKRPFLFDCLRDFVKVGENNGAKWYSCGKVSLKGHPHHPLYLRKDSCLDEFDIHRYMSIF